MKLYQDDIVEYDNGLFSGVGKIKGIAVMDQAVIGKTYIVESIDGIIPNKIYPYNTIVVFECHIKTTNKE